MNNKGFMMAELVVVSSIIIIALTSFYVSYNKIITSYNKTLNYYDIGTVYRLGYYYRTKIDEIKLNENEISKTIFKNNEKTYNNVKYKDTLILALSHKINSNNGISSNDNNINETFKDYIKYVNNSVSLKDDTLYLILESCQSKNNNDQCKYEYMEVPNAEA